MTREQIEKLRAERENSAIRGFYVHFVIYALVIAFLIPK